MGGCLEKQNYLGKASSGGERKEREREREREGVKQMKQWATGETKKKKNECAEETVRRIDGGREAVWKVPKNPRARRPS